MGAQAFVVTRTDYPRPLNVVGEHITVLASGLATGGYEIFLQQGPEGSGPIPHSRTWDESFFVTQGEADFGIGDARRTAIAGTMHWFRFRAGAGTMISMTSRLGASGMFTEMDRDIAPDQPDVEKLAAIAVRHGLTAQAPA